MTCSCSETLLPLRRQMSVLSFFADVNCVGKLSRCALRLSAAMSILLPAPCAGSLMTTAAWLCQHPHSRRCTDWNNLVLL